MVPEELKIISFDGEKEVIGVVGRIIKSFLDGKGKVNAGFRENVLYLVNVCLRIVCLVTYQKFEPYEDFGSATTVVASTITSIITVWLLYNKFEMGIYDKIKVHNEVALLWRFPKLNYAKINSILCRSHEKG
ncbi:unnamed protein product [Arabidopsis thaliana]|uniref:Uncharacterized protein n=1 Tax=Arabidopsis thaliana TaxID=3702 RepID=A0A5S9XZ56_ARATH|nr:unnamed protein product [Arabidopsis thaliana]